MTVVGMLSVVLMAYLFPPLVFNWLVKKDGRLRIHPLTLANIFTHLRGKGVQYHYGDDIPLSFAEVRTIVFGRYIYKGKEIEDSARKNLRYIERNYTSLTMAGDGNILIIDDMGQGELALTLALLYPGKTIICALPSDDSRRILEGCLIDFVSNVSIISQDEAVAYPDNGLKKIILSKET